MWWEYLGTPAMSASSPNIPLIRSNWLFNNLTASDCPSFSSDSKIPFFNWFKFRVICGKCKEFEPEESEDNLCLSRSKDRVWVDMEVSLAKVAIFVGKRWRKEGLGCGECWYWAFRGCRFAESQLVAATTATATALGVANADVIKPNYGSLQLQKPTCGCCQWSHPRRPLSHHEANGECQTTMISFLMFPEYSCGDQAEVCRLPFTETLRPQKFTARAWGLHEGCRWLVGGVVWSKM